MSAANFRFTHSPAVPGRSVGAACMRPVNLPPPPVPGIIDALPPPPVPGIIDAISGVCRGGIVASRQGCTPHGVCGIIDRFPYPVGRAFTPAAHYIILKIIGAAGPRPRPTMQGKHHAGPATGNTAMFAGGIHASRQGCTPHGGLRDNRPYTPRLPAPWGAVFLWGGRCSQPAGFVV